MLIRFKFVKINSLFLGNALIAEIMNIELSNLLRRLGNAMPSCVEIYACDGDCPDQLNNGYSWKALKDAVNAVELSEIIVRNTAGVQLAWYLVSSGDEGIIDHSGINY